MITLYTDGSCLKNPGPGGWAFLALTDNNLVIKQQSGHCISTTNNQMELQAVIEALSWAHEQGYNSILLLTDSRYVQQGMLSWLSQWKKNNWHTSNKGPVKNQEYWRQLDALNAKMRVQWEWVKAHHTDKHNAMVDKIAREAALSVGV